MAKTLLSIAAIFMTMSFASSRSFPAHRVLRQTNEPNCTSNGDNQYLYTALFVAKATTVMVINNTTCASLLILNLFIGDDISEQFTC